MSAWTLPVHHELVGGVHLHRSDVEEFLVYARHTLFVMGGSLLAQYAGGKPEIWECTIRGVQADSLGEPVNDPLAWLRGIKQPLADWYHAEQNLMSAASTLDYIKANNIGPDGKYESRVNTNRLDYAPVIVGGASPVVPDILTVCWSWRTGRQRGPGSHGRIYPPNNTAQPAQGMAISTSQQAQHLAAAQRLMHVLNVGDGDTNAMHPVVASKVDASNTPITEIWIGNIVDVQRRRKSAEPELYSVGPWSV